MGHLRDRRAAILRALEAERRDPGTFELIAQVHTGPAAADRTRAFGQARETVAAGATEVVVGVPAALGPAALEAAHRDGLGPLRGEHG